MKRLKLGLVIDFWYRKIPYRIYLIPEEENKENFLSKQNIDVS